MLLALLLAAMPGPQGPIYSQPALLRSEAPAAPVSSLVTDLEAYFAFESNANDATGAHNGTATDTVYASAIISNGISNTLAYPVVPTGLVALDAGITLGAEFTIDLWVKPASGEQRQSSFAGYGAFFGSAASDAFYLRDDGTTQSLQFWAGNALRMSYVVTPGTGYWVTLIQDGSSVVMRINNAQVASWVGTVSWTINVLLQVAGLYSVAAQVDELGVWNRVLTGDELTSRYNAGAGRTYPF